ncbi:MAG TPA: hypothetical protein VFT04_05715 [Gemmatimonadales bacterium]|nr:hypothetical protein [Gemmatimonadales bacterium]
MISENRGARMGRILAAGVAASGVGALAAWLGYATLILLTVGAEQALSSAPSLLGFFLLIGWPIALVATLIAGSILQRLLRRNGLLRRTPAVLAAGAVGAVVLPLAWAELDSLLGDPSGGAAVLIGAFSGLAAGWVFWSIIARPPGQAAAADRAML